jgi:hypothetical protein
LPVLHAGGLDLASAVPLEPLEAGGADPAAGTLTEPAAPLGPLAPPIWAWTEQEPAPATPESRVAPAQKNPFVTTTEGVAARVAVGQRYGLDLTGVPIDRSPTGATRARDIGARAFTGAGGVVIPAAAGSLESGPGAALLAHELTHVAQRARSRTALPPERSEAAMLLEGEAVQAETAAASVLAGRVPSTGKAPAGAPVGPAERADATEALQTGVPLPVASPPPAGVDKATLTAMLTEMAERLNPFQDVEHTVQVTPGVPASWSPQAEPSAAVASEAAPAAGVQMAPNVRSMASKFEQQAKPPPSPSDGLRSLWPNRPSETDLEKMARWLYPLISYRMRSELRDGRTRTGDTTDVYGRW